VFHLLVGILVVFIVFFIIVVIQIICLFCGLGKVNILATRTISDDVLFFNFVEVI